MNRQVLAAVVTVLQETNEQDIIEYLEQIK